MRSLKLRVGFQGLMAAGSAADPQAQDYIAVQACAARLGSLQAAKADWEFLECLAWLPPNIRIFYAAKCKEAMITAR